LEAWSTVVAAVGTAGALVYAAVGLSRERKTRRAEIGRLDETQRAEQDRQARTVVLHDPGCGGLQWVSIKQYNVTLGNYGRYPITNIVGMLTYRTTGLQVVYGNGGPVPLPVLEAGSRQTLHWDLSGHTIVWPKNIQSHELPDLFAAEVRFTDVHGIRWAVRPRLGQQPSRILGIDV
jgi:hypothetical protein